MVLDKSSKSLTKTKLFLPNISKLNTSHSGAKINTISQSKDNYQSRKKAIEKYNNNLFGVPNFSSIDNDRIRSLEVFLKIDDYNDHFGNNQNSSNLNHQDIKKNDNEKCVKNIVKQGDSFRKKIQNNRKGKIFVSELWSRKVYNEMLKITPIKEDLEKLQVLDEEKARLRDLIEKVFDLFSFFIPFFFSFTLFAFFFFKFC